MTKIETPEEKKNRELTEGIAKNIQKLVDSVRALLKGPLKRRTILILLSSSSGLTKTDVEKVLLALETMDSDWLNS